MSHYGKKVAKYTQPDDERSGAVAEATRLWRGPPVYASQMSTRPTHARRTEMHAGLSGLDLPFAIANPGLRSRARSSPGYHMAGLRPWESGAQLSSWAGLKRVRGEAESL